MFSYDLNEIFGGENLGLAKEINIPRCPIIDDPHYKKLTAAETARVDARIEKMRTAEMMKNLIGDFAKDAVFDNPSLQDDTQARQSSSVTGLPAPVRDPRRAVCRCDCEFCERLDHINCDADSPCPQSHASVVESTAIDIAAQVKEQFKLALAEEVRRLSTPQKKITKKKSKETEFMEKHYGYEALIGQFQR